MNALTQRESIVPLGQNWATRLTAYDWRKINGHLDTVGYAVIPGLLQPEECRSIAALYSRRDLFRSRIVMEHHAFGRGEYQYFRYPLPNAVGGLRNGLYLHLAPTANRWYELMGLPTRFPTHHADFVARCHESGQVRPTPLLVQYEIGDYNCLHQDLYGEHVFPLQVAIPLAQPGRDFTGGEFVLTEQRPRMQSLAEVIRLEQGDAVVFAVHYRPVAGTRGIYRANIRHGVSRIRSGIRHTLGIIFHDAT